MALPAVLQRPIPAATANPLLRKVKDASLLSGHWCDVHQAVRQGCPIDTQVLRQAAGDEKTWQQEYECVFHSDRDHYFPIDLIVECEHPEATAALPSGWQPDPRQRVLLRL